MDTELSAQQRLREQARAAVDEVSDNPAGRLALRQQFYAKYDYGHHGEYGFGQSELDFIQWEIRRGVLNPLQNEASKGSPWWRSVNLELCYHAQLAALYQESGILPEGESGAVLQWLNYFADPTPRTWYRAHNRSIAGAYAKFSALALQEEAAERVFMNEVLIRLLYAQAMAEGENFAFGSLGELLADPDSPSVQEIISLPDFYPDHYPLTAQDVQDVEYKARCLADKLAEYFDEALIEIHLQQLFGLAEKWLGLEGLATFIKADRPVYPDVTEPVASAQVTTPITSFTAIPKKKIVIMGGGMSSLTTAYELTNYAGWQDKFDITLYQMGWRLGGKTATGRGVHNRIQERGIHIFQGWYDNAWRLVKDAYRIQEEEQLNPDSPFKTWRDAFSPHNTTLLTEFSFLEGKWINWPIIFPPNDLEPGTDKPQTTWELLHKVIGLSLEMVLGSPYQKGNMLTRWIFGDLLDVEHEPADGPAPSKHGFFHSLVERIEKRFEAALFHELYTVADRLLAAPHHEKELHFSRTLELLEKIFHWVDKHVEALLTRDNKMRRIVILLEWIFVNLKGIFSDVYVKETYQFNYKLVNEYDYRSWLRKHGGSELLLHSAPVRFIYTGSFANLLGEDPGEIATDVALRMCLLSVSYKGSFISMLNAGTGDTVVTPIYQVLKKRGVRFRFFHRLDRIHYSTTGEIEALTMAEQVNLKDPDGNYNPTVKVNGINSWPAEPLYDQLVDEQAQELQAGKINLESAWSPWKDQSLTTLKKGVDFDQIVLGIPAAALKTICSEITEQNSRWKDMVEKVVMVPTFGAQIWAKPDLAALGYNPSTWGLPAGSLPDSVSYTNPHYSWTDMTPILQQESWDERNKPGHVSYFCGTIAMPSPLPPPSSTLFPHEQKIRIMALTEQWLHSYLGWFFPKAASLEYPTGFDLSLLIDPDDTQPPLQGLDKLAKQYFSVNIDPSNHYTLALPGTNKYRFKAADTGFSNLFVCGDWTDFGLNVGHIEGAVVSGLRCAHAILNTYGIIKVNPILGSAENIDF